MDLCFRLRSCFGIMELSSVSGFTLSKNLRVPLSPPLLFPSPPQINRIFKRGKKKKNLKCPLLAYAAGLKKTTDSVRTTI